MGTVFVFQIQDQVPEPELERHCQAALEILNEADELFSLYKPESEISKLVRGELPWPKATAVQRSIRDQTQDWKTITGGFFDSRSDSEYDPSGLVKGWAAQNAAHYLEANGIRDFTLNAGGDVYLSAGLTKSFLTRVGIANLKPVASAEAGVSLVLELFGTDYHAVATSGIAERGEHIWRNQGSKRFIQVSVVAKDLITADIWATALVAGGDLAWPVFLENAHDAVAFGVFDDGSMLASKGFAALLANH